MPARKTKLLEVSIRQESTALGILKLFHHFQLFVKHKFLPRSNISQVDFTPWRYNLSSFNNFQHLYITQSRFRYLMTFKVLCQAMRYDRENFLLILFYTTLLKCLPFLQQLFGHSSFCPRRSYSRSFSRKQPIWTFKKVYICLDAVWLNTIILPIVKNLYTHGSVSKRQMSFEILIINYLQFRQD